MKNSIKIKNIKRETHIIDATDKPLGRLASQIAVILRGKHKPNFSPHIDLGDFVVVKNVAKIKITGKKLEQKKYRSHSGYPGGLKERKMKDIFLEHPEEILSRAVKGMLPSTRFRTRQIQRLKFEK